MQNIRQGDVLLRPLSKLEAECRDKGTPVPAEGGRVILGLGEGFGHTHSLPFGGAYLYRDSEGARTLTIDVPTRLEHLIGGMPTGEHAALDVPPGDYEVIQQQGLSPDMAPRHAPD